MSLKRPQRRYPAIPTPGNDIASLQASINALKETVETLVRLRGDDTDSAVAVRDLANLPPEIGFTPTKLSDWGSTPPRTVQAALDTLITGSGGSTPAPTGDVPTIQAWAELSAGTTTMTTITNGSGMLRFTGSAFNWTLPFGQGQSGLVWFREVVLLNSATIVDAKMRVVVNSKDIGSAVHAGHVVGGRLYILSWVGVYSTATVPHHEPQPYSGPIFVTILAMP